MTEEEQLTRAAKAEALMNDPELAAAFDGVRMAIFRQIEHTPVRDTEGLTYLRLMLKSLEDVRANLNAHIQDGKLIVFHRQQEEARKAGIANILSKIKRAY